MLTKQNTEVKIAEGRGQSSLGTRDRGVSRGFKTSFPSRNQVVFLGLHPEEQPGLETGTLVAP